MFLRLMGTRAHVLEIHGCESPGFWISWVRERMFLGFMGTRAQVSEISGYESTRFHH